jgi:hypothetical protein
MKDVATVLYELMELHTKKMCLQYCMSSWSCQGKCAKGLVWAHRAVYEKCGYSAV